MDATKTEEFKKKLLEEKARLETELASVGHINPDNPKDWEADPGDWNAGRDADPNLRADTFEEFENRTAILKQLEIQLGDVNLALANIEAGTYGICEVGGEEIEENRLAANPSARTCSVHMNG